MKKRKWVTRDINQDYGASLRCNFHTRVIVRAEKTPSGTRYDFQPGEVKEDVLAEDQEYLLSLINNQSACCGGKPGESINYFELV